MNEIGTHEKLIKKCLQSSVDNPSRFLKFKKQFCSQHKIPQPTNADLRELYEKMIKQRKIKRNLELEKAMLSRAVRTQSGVAVVAVLTKPSDCPGKCIFCPTEKNMPKSYLSNEPAVMRAIMNRFDPYRQVQSRVKALELNGHMTDKIELIVMGGTFSYFPKSYQKKFITQCFKAANDYPRNKKGILKGTLKDTLSKEQKRNEKARHRIVGLTLETRPDYIDEKEIINFRNLGCTRVELGVQSIFDDVLKLNNRGHDVAETIRATKLLKDAGFKINYHMMPGLLGSNPQRDYKMFEKLFSSQSFQPDMLKIYPTVVTRNSQLYKLWRNKKYKVNCEAREGTLGYEAMTDRQFENLVIKIKNNIIPQYTRIQRLVRDVPLPSIEAGPKVSNLRQLVAEKTNCQCIRCREIKGEYKSSSEIILDRIDYDASGGPASTRRDSSTRGGQEIFLQFTSPNKQKLYALLRLRIPSSLCHSRENGNLDPQVKPEDDKLHNLMPTLKNAAIVREVHTYGKLEEIGKQSKGSPQHIGLGKKLIKEAESIARKEFGISKIAIISGIGVRDYYRKLGYRLKDTYMIKNI